MYNVQLRNLFAHSDGQASVPHCFHSRDFRRKAWPQPSPAPCLTQCRLMCVQRLGRIGAQTAPGDFATPPSNLATSPCDANGGTVPRLWLWVPFSLWKRKLKKWKRGQKPWKQVKHSQRIISKEHTHTYHRATSGCSICTHNMHVMHDSTNIDILSSWMVSSLHAERGTVSAATCTSQGPVRARAQSGSSFNL